MNKNVVLNNVVQKSADGGSLVDIWSRKFVEMIKKYLSLFIADRLNRKDSDYFYRVLNDMDKLKKHIRRGDVILVEGNQRISKLVKIFTQSNWSHSAVYIGDELIREDGPHKKKVLEQFGDKAKHLLVEALTSGGVIVNPIDKYEHYNIRICRPYGITKDDLQNVIDHVIRNIGKKYDNRNILHLALSLIPFGLNPLKDKSIEVCIGNCDEFTVICSGMIAKAFQSVGYPISPAVELNQIKELGSKKNTPYGDTVTRRHYSQITPADFDLSSNFDIVKFNIIEDGYFDYKSLNYN